MACFRKLLHNYYYFYYCSLYKINQIKLLLFYLATESGQMYSYYFYAFHVRIHVRHGEGKNLSKYLQCEIEKPFII